MSFIENVTSNVANVAESVVDWAKENNGAACAVAAGVIGGLYFREEIGEFVSDNKLLTAAVVLGTAYYYRDEISEFVNGMVSSEEVPTVEVLTVEA